MGNYSISVTVTYDRFGLDSPQPTPGSITVLGLMRYEWDDIERERQCTIGYRTRIGISAVRSVLGLWSGERKRATITCHLYSNNTN